MQADITEKHISRRAYRRKKRFTVLLAVMLLLPVLALKAAAVDLDSNEFAIDVDVQASDVQPVSDAQIALYHVAQGQLDADGNLHMKPMEAFADLEFDGITQETLPMLLDKLCPRLQQPEENPQSGAAAPIQLKKAGSDGMIHFRDLNSGVYVLLKWQDGAAKDWEMLPALVYLPRYQHAGDRWENTAVVVPKWERNPEHPVEPKPNEPDALLPQTGVVQWPIPVLLMAGLTCMGIGVRTYRHGKQDEAQ